jgi:mono/diheme cytochrome c family protein/glucose/arabinose dehydrogenase/lysophospholipase L1-like esterase
MPQRLLPTLLASLAAFAPASALSAADALLALNKGDRVAIMGSGVADRLQHDGWLETLIQQAFPTHELTIRNIAYSCDEVVVRVQTDTGATRDEWLAKLKTDVVLAFYGFNESFAGEAGLAKFKEELDGFLKKTLTATYNGTKGPRVVLFSPIAQEKHPDPHLPDPTANNKNLALYTTAMAEVAKANNVPFVDLFAASQKLYAAAKQPLTFNGIHLTESGNQALAPVIVKELFAITPPAPSPTLEKLRAAVVDKSETWHARYRTVDSYNIYQQRSKIGYQSGTDKEGKPGPKITNAEVMHVEMEVRDVMTANRDKRIWSVAQGGDTKVEDVNLPEVPKVGTNLPGVNADGSHVYLSGEEAITKMTMPEKCKITLFASEKEFPELVKPVQMAWDTKGRLWVAAWPNYPSRTPDSKDGDKLLILEDTNNDGKADKCITFTDELNCPTGFTFYKDGVLVMKSPDLWFMRDTDGDGKADWKERVLMGLDAADSHHETNSMVLDPGGATYLSDGVFHRTQVETAAGPVRNVDGAIYRYEPRSQRFERYVPYGFLNPHGRSFDTWGNDIITDGTGNLNYFAPAFSGRLDFPHKHPKMNQFWERPSRPCPGTAFLSSRHFPDEWNGSFLNLNVIGFQGIFRVKASENGSGLKGESQEDLLKSSDKNFRPVGASVAPDGSLYILDWANAIIGHLQHHLRDPNRDKIHGRIYRMTYEGRPLVKANPIDGQPIPALLEELKAPEDNQRLRAKMELGKRDSSQVTAAVTKWIDGLDKKDANYEHHVLEGLWVHQWHNVVNIPLLKRVLTSPDHRARAAAARVLCYWRDRVPEALALFKTLAGDEHPRVRLEAVRAASFYSGADVAAANEIAYTILKKPTDYYLDYCYQETLKQLRLQDKNPYLPKDPEFATIVTAKEAALALAAAKEKGYGPKRKLEGKEKKAYELGKEVFNREAHCITCHQPDGKGLPNIYPPLTNKEWIADDERLIKIVLKGLWGPMKVGDKAFDPAKGVPPMTGFAALLKDEEVAAVLTYVRQSFGNDLDPIKTEQVAKIRKATDSKAGFYTVEELMKEHPIPGWETWKAK